MKAIINGKIITEEKVLENKMLVFNERILEFKKQKNSEYLFETFEEIIDAKWFKPEEIYIHSSDISISSWLIQNFIETYIGDK